MATLDTATPTRPGRKSRKSVSFTEQQVVVDSSGSVTVVAAPDEDRDTAQSHKPATPPLSVALGAFADPENQADLAEEVAAAAQETAAAMAAEAEAIAEVPPAEEGGLDLTMMKKKKKKKKVEIEGAEEGEEVAEVADDDGAAAPADDGLDLSMKKKKKKKVVKEAEEDDFAAKLKALELEGKDVDAAQGDVETSTDLFQHDETKMIPYNMLLKRFFVLLSQKNPDHALSGTKAHKIPPPQCMREGNKKTIFANIADICKRMKRSEEHVTAYLFAELGTSGSVDGSRRLTIKGRFQQKQIENVLRKYIYEYVSCATCKSPDTELSRGENRLNFITCNSCGSRRSVTAIKTGFSAQVGRRRKMKG